MQFNAFALATFDALAVFSGLSNAAPTMALANTTSVIANTTNLATILPTALPTASRLMVNEPTYNVLTARGSDKSGHYVATCKWKGKGKRLKLVCKRKWVKGPDPRIPIPKPSKTPYQSEPDNWWNRKPIDQRPSDWFRGKSMDEDGDEVEEFVFGADVDGDDVVAALGVDAENITVEDSSEDDSYGITAVMGKKKSKGHYEVRCKMKGKGKKQKMVCKEKWIKDPKIKPGKSPYSSPSSHSSPPSTKKKSLWQRIDDALGRMAYQHENGRYKSRYGSGAWLMEAGLGDGMVMNDTTVDMIVIGLFDGMCIEFERFNLCPLPLFTPTFPGCVPSGNFQICHKQNLQIEFEEPETETITEEILEELEELEEIQELEEIELEQLEEINEEIEEAIRTLGQDPRIQPYPDWTEERFEEYEDDNVEDENEDFENRFSIMPWNPFKNGCPKGLSPRTCQLFRSGKMGA